MSMPGVETTEKPSAVLGALKLEVKHLLAEITAAIPAMRDYCAKNPRHNYRDVLQDPNGVHAWLARNDMDKTL